MALGLRATLSKLPAPWMVLANGTDGPPWVRFVALCPQKGIALIDTGRPEAAVAPLEDFLSRTGLPALRAGALPIVPVAVGAGEVDAVAEMLDAALAPTQGRISNPSWYEGAVELLLTAPDLKLVPLHRVGPAAEAEGAAPTHPDHPVDFQDKPLRRIGVLRPDSALLDWPPEHRRWFLAMAALLFLAAVGRTAVEHSSTPLYGAALRPPSLIAPRQTMDVLSHAMLLPMIANTSPATKPAPPAPDLATLTLAPVSPPFQTVVTPQPKPVAPVSRATADETPRAASPPAIAPARHATVKPVSTVLQKAVVARDPAPNRGGGADVAWYDRGATTASNAGLTALVAPGARNNNFVPANLGTAHLASGTAATLDFYGDGLVSIAIDGQALARTIDPSTGKPLGAAVGKTRMLTTARGTVLVTPNVAANVVDDVINTSGVTQARSASKQNGQIVLEGGSGGSGGTVQVAGTQGASDNRSGGKTFVSGGPPSQDQDVVYTTTAVTVAQQATAEAKSITSGVDGTITDAVAQGATDTNAITTSVDKAVADVPTTVTHVVGTVGAAGSTLTNTVNSLTKPVTSLALPAR